MSATGSIRSRSSASPAGPSCSKLPPLTERDLKREPPMIAVQTRDSTTAPAPDKWANLRKQYGCGPVAFIGTDDALVELYSSPGSWTHKAILNVAASGKFSSDRSIAE